MTRKPLFHADWLNAVFLHFRVDADALQREVPLELDRFDGDAYVSLVAFTQARLRLARGGEWIEWLSAPLARHAFLNLRAYVRHRGEQGIYFLAEWIPNRLATLIGPRVYGLPYRLGKLRYANDLRLGRLAGSVSAQSKALTYAATLPSRDFDPVSPGSLDAFLLERYTAFTGRASVLRRFDVSHDPWPAVRIDAQILRSDLPASVATWWPGAKLVSANYSPGVYDVGISAPLRLAAAERFRQAGPSKSPPAQLRSPAGRERRIP